MNTQQLRDLVQKAYYKQKMALRKERKNPQQFLISTATPWTGSRGHPTPDSAKPPHREWNAPPSNRERYSHADTRPKQRYDRWDGPRGRQRSPGRHWDKSWDQARPHESPWDRSWNQPSSYGNSKGKRQLTLEQSAQGIDERSHQDSKLTELKLNPHKNKEHHRISTHRSWWKWWWRVLPTKRGGPEVEKKEKPDSAWLAVKRKGRVTSWTN